MAEFGQVDLTSCDREPIHVPGSIQPHGCLVTCTMSEFTVLRHSANAPLMLDRDDLKLGCNLIELFGPDIVHDIRNALTLSVTQRRPVFLLNQGLGLESNFDLAVHMVDGEVVLECEPAAPTQRATKFLTQLHGMMDRVRKTTDIARLFDVVTMLMRGLLDYDRVMVYRFADDWSGKVVSEARALSLESFLGQHFPSADIPAQARELYRRSPIRMIADVLYTPVPLVETEGLTPLDMSLGQLRSVSPIHCEYLTNMGVRASMSISIVIDGALWGMIACHHYSPRALPIAERAVVQMFSEFFALQIIVILKTTRLQVAERTHGLIESVLRNAASVSDMPAYLRGQISRLAPLIQSDGIAIWIDNEWTGHGISAPKDVQREFVELARKKAGTQIWQSDHLVKDHPWIAAHTADLAGVLIIPISPQPENYVFLFRREIVQTINWGGDPNKTYEHGPHGPRLTPRQSFAIWKEQVHERCLPWSSFDIEAAGQLRSALIEVMGVYHQQQLSERADADLRQRMLNEELNHRVKNILAVVQSLVGRPVGGDRTIEDYVETLRGRIKALASAHDQVARSDGGGLLRVLLEAELEPYRHQPSAVQLEGPNLWLSGPALSVSALTLHELATNAAKYGALSRPSGTLKITWFLDAAQGGWVLEWIESGGPPVTPPKSSGFGSVLLERAIPHELGGTSLREFRPEGLYIRLTFPESHAVLVSEKTEAPEPDEVGDATAAQSALLHSARVLLVEDQLLIAMETEQALNAAGVRHIRTVSSVYEALQAIKEQSPDVALLDFNLGKESSEDIASVLRKKGIPFLFATGYADRTMIPQEFEDVPILRKPYTVKNAVQELLKVLPV
ncbi:HWE histidine kinase domain-containing protein [Asaia astilbis]